MKIRPECLDCGWVGETYKVENREDAIEEAVEHEDVKHGPRTRIEVVEP